MIRIKSFITSLMMIFTILFSNTTAVVYAQETAYTDIDITTSSVRDDLASMGEDKLSYVSTLENIFIAMAQYYDKNETLRTYVYLNWIYDFDEYTHYINLSTAVMDENYNITEDFKNYNLNYVNNDETWYKFEVVGLSNLEETTRRYSINHIGIIADETSSELLYQKLFTDINKTYIFNGVSNNTIQVFRQEVETITITDKEVNFYCYGDDLDVLFWESEDWADDFIDENNTYKDIWYIFFNTDKPMDELLEIELTYQEYIYNICYTNGTSKLSDAITEAKYNEIINDLPLGYQSDYYKDKFYLNKKEQVKDIIYPGTEKVVTDTSNWYGKHTPQYEVLDNILNLKEYQAKDNDKFVFTTQADKYDWGVKFLVTDRYVKETRTQNGNEMPAIIEGSGVCNTAILRLKYKVDDVVHNAYAVDIPTDDFTGNTAEEEDESPFEEWFEKIVMLVGILILIVILGYLSPIFSVVFKALITCIKWAVKGILLVITAPFKMIGALFKKRK